MFAVGDIVQPRIGGPKLKVLEVHDDPLPIAEFPCMST